MLTNSISNHSLSLLLTATIDPRNCFYVKRSDPRVRLDDYKSALRRWLGDTRIEKIIFCENSGFDLSELDTIATTENRHGKAIALLSYTAEEQGHRGKGYGEMGIIKFALSNSTLADRDMILKVTGRYYITNISNILSSISKEEDADVITSKPRHNETWVDSECYCATKYFMGNYFCRRQEEIDGSQRVYIEHVLAASIVEARLAGLMHAVFENAPQIDGVSGTVNLPWQLLCNGDRGFARPGSQ